MIYETVFEMVFMELDEKVTKLLSEGWKLYGNPYAAIEDDGGEKTTWYCQAVTKEI